MDELYYNKKSEEYVETLEEVEAYRINISDLKNLMETNLELCNWGRIIHQNEYRRLHRSHKERLSLPAKERYEEFQKQFPEICKKVNLKYIASYLGITLSTLSRLRSKKP
jgi:DNA-directed RNA polymerase specialized sigma subunit